MNEQQEIKINDLVVLRRVSPGDSEAFFALIDRNRSHLSQFDDQTAVKYPTLESVREKNINQGPDEYRFGIWDTDTLVGFVKVTRRGSQRMEVGYWLGEEFSGKGYMTKAVSSLTSFALNRLENQTVFGKVVKGNRLSVQVLQRAGYHLVGDNPENPGEVILEFP